MVRLQRSITRTPMLRAEWTSQRKWRLSSGAPPVMSSVAVRRRWESQHEVDRVAVHFLGAVRTRIHVTVDAGLIAAISRLTCSVSMRSPDRRERDGFEQGQVSRMECQADRVMIVPDMAPAARHHKVPLHTNKLA